MPLPRAGLRPRLHDLKRPADEQVARHDRRSARGGADRLGADPLRLYLVKEIAFGGDGDFSWERFDERYNADLANNLGNLVSRVASMAERYRGGRLTPAGAPGRLAARRGDSVAAYRRAMERFALHDGAAAAYRLIDAANEFIAETEPWALAKDPEQADRLTQVLFDVAEAIRIAAVLLLPIMPSSAAEILRRVGERARRRPAPRPRCPLAQRRRACARQGRAAVAALRSHAGDGRPAKQRPIAVPPADAARQHLMRRTAARRAAAAG